MERETGIEPATSSLGSWHSTAELLPLAMLPNYNKNIDLIANSKSFDVRLNLLPLSDFRTLSLFVLD